SRKALRRDLERHQHGVDPTRGEERVEHARRADVRDRVRDDAEQLRVAGDHALCHSAAIAPGRCAANSLSAAAISARWGIAAVSSTLEMLGDASPPVTRITGWSSQS